MTFRIQTDNTTLLALVGVMVGVAVRICVPGFPWWAFFFSTFGISFVLTFHHNQKDAMKTAVYAVSIAAFMALSGWLSAHFMGNGDINGFFKSVGAQAGSSIGSMFYGSIVFIISAAFFMAYSAKGYWNADYKLLDQFAWNRPLIYIGAWIFVLIFWIILFLWLSLFLILGISIFKTIFLKPMFVFASVGGAFALGATILMSKETIIAASRSLLESLFSVLTPLLSAFVVLFLLVLPATGLKAIWNTGNTSAMIAALVVFSILFLNAVIRAEGLVTSRLNAVCARVLCVCMPALVFISFWSLGVRISEYGLTPRRIDAVILMSIAGLYASTYAVAALLHWRGGWEAALRRVNVYNALIVLVVAAVMVTPIVNVRALSAWQQKTAFLVGKISVDHFDFAAMKYRLGKPGLDALEEIRVAAANHPQRASILEALDKVDKSDNYYQLARTKPVNKIPEIKTIGDVVSSYTLVPADTRMTSDMIEALNLMGYQNKDCLKAMQNLEKPENRCLISLVDVYGDATSEILIQSAWGTPTILYRKADEKWARMNTVIRGSSSTDFKMQQEKTNRVRDSILAGQVQAVPTDYKMLKIGDFILQIAPSED